MSLSILYRDEFKGFAKSKVMSFLWIGMPALALLIQLLRPTLNQPQISMLMFSTFMTSSLCGTIASVMLSIGIIHEKSRGVYPLFLVRPVKRRDILLAKFLAVFSCVAAAAIITILTGILYDLIKSGTIPALILKEAGKSILVSFSVMAISSSAGILIGILSPSVLVGVILVLYGGNQLAALMMLPAILELPNPQLISVGFSTAASILLLWISIYFFNRKQF